MSHFSLEFFCLAVSKNFVGEPVRAVFPKIFGSKKFIDDRGGEYQEFPLKITCRTVPKRFIGESFSVSLISGIEKS